MEFPCTSAGLINRHIRWLLRVERLASVHLVPDYSISCRQRVISPNRGFGFLAGCWKLRLDPLSFSFFFRKLLGHPIGDKMGVQSTIVLITIFLVEPAYR